MCIPSLHLMHLHQELVHALRALGVFLSAIHSKRFSELENALLVMAGVASSLFWRTSLCAGICWVSNILSPPSQRSTIAPSTLSTARRLQSTRPASTEGATRTW